MPIIGKFQQPLLNLKKKKMREKKKKKEKIIANLRIIH